MRFDIRNYFKTGKTPYTAQFSEDFSTENFDGSVIREPVTGSFQAMPTADGVVMQLTIAAEPMPNVHVALHPFTRVTILVWIISSKSVSLMTRTLSYRWMKKAAWIYGSSCTRN